MNIEPLLAPLPGEEPCGADLGFETEFDTVQELRREDDPTLAQGEWVTELKRADWPAVITLCSKLLTERSKDLRLAGWWLDASARVSGYQGLADGLALVSGLCTSYWSALHPRSDEGDWELRIGNLSWLLGRVEAMAKAAPFLQSGDERYSLRDLLAARGRRNKPGEQSDTPTPAERLQHERDERILRSLRVLGPDKIAQVHHQCLRAREALTALESVVDRELGQNGPAFAAARQALDEAVHEFDRLLREAGGGQPAASPASPSSSVEVSQGVTMNVPSGAPTSRAQALAQLRLVADFFRRTEPHSPVAYLADKAAYWGDMPLHTWLRSVMREPGALAHLEELLGIEPPRDRE